MDTGSFARFGTDHLVALAVVAAIAALVTLAARRVGEAARRRLRIGLATLMITGAAAEVVVGWLSGQSLQEVAPLQLCDLSLALGAVTLLTLSRRTVEPLYFFAMSGTLIALLTPELPCTRLTDFRFVSYFGLHGLTVIAAVALVAGFGVVPARGGWWRAFLWLNAWSVVVSLVNIAAQTNFMYLRAKPTVPTLFDRLGVWPWYLLSLELVALALFLVLAGALLAARRVAALAGASRPAVASGCA